MRHHFTTHKLTTELCDIKYFVYFNNWKGYTCLMKGLIELNRMGEEGKPIHLRADEDDDFELHIRQVAFSIKTRF